MGRDPRLTVRPGALAGGRFRVPGDKSITHRAILFGLLAHGQTRIEGANPGADCAATLQAAIQLGATVDRREGAIVIEGTGGVLTEARDVVDCGNAGTALRLLAGVVAAHPMLTVLSGDASLRSRPVARVIAPLRAMGATLRARDGGQRPPLVIEGAALTGVSFDEPTASAQVASATLLAGLQARGVTRVVTAAGVRDHTQRMLPAFGVPVTVEAHGPDGATRIAVEGPCRLDGARVEVPGDFSAAAFFLAAAAATPGCELTVERANINPTRVGLLRALEAMGASVQIRPWGDAAGEPVGDITVRGPDALDGIDIPAEWVPALVDEVPAWMVAACAARGTSRLRGAAELRLKESDRLAALAQNLAALGVRVEETSDGLAIHGGRVRGGTIEAHGDHRVAMAFALLAGRAEGPITIDDASPISTSFPDFGATLAALGGQPELSTGDGRA